MTRVAFANALRGVAALSVVISHYDSFFFGNAEFLGAIANIAPPPRVTSSALA
jgi:peptidoglycan/LPS O-acetylase OafA/YrhL